MNLKFNSNSVYSSTFNKKKGASSSNLFQEGEDEYSQACNDAIINKQKRVELREKNQRGSLGSLIKSASFVPKTSS